MPRENKPRSDRGHADDAATQPQGECQRAWGLLHLHSSAFLVLVTTTMLLAIAMVLATLAPTCFARAQRVFSFHDPMEPRVKPDPIAMNSTDVDDTASGREQVERPHASDFGGGAVAIAVVGCVVLVVIVIGVVYVCKAARTMNDRQWPMDGVDSSKASESIYQHSLERPHSSRHGRSAGGRRRVAFADSRTSAINAHGIITIRPGTSLLDQYDPTTHATTSRVPHTPPLPPPGRTTGALPTITEPRWSNDSAISSESELVSIVGNVVRPDVTQGTHPFEPKFMRRPTDDVSFGSALTASPTTPPRLFSPHSPAHSPSSGSARESTLSVDDDEAEVAL